MDSSEADSKSFLHASMNSCLDTLNGEILNFFSVANSIGKPFLSKPKGNRTSKPFILLYLAKKSMYVYVVAWPIWMGVLTYGGGVSIEYIFFFVFGLNAKI